MTSGAVDFGSREFQEALRRVPERFHAAVRQHVEDIAGKLNIQHAEAPALIESARESAVQCAIDGFTQLRWYLLDSEDRLLMAEQAWQLDGMPGLCLYLRERHLAEKIVLVTGEDGDVQRHRLDAIRAATGATRVAVALGEAAANAVEAWAQDVGLSCDRFELEAPTAEASAALLDKLAPHGVYILGDGRGERLLAEYARKKGAREVSTSW